MARTVHLHIGLPKSGTTYLQAVLGDNKRELRERESLLYPGASWAHQADAVSDVCRLRTVPGRQEKVRGAWQRLVDEMQAWPGDCVVSMEWLCMAKPAQVARIVKDLAPADVKVAVTVRDVGRTVPSAWQEFCRNERTWTWPDFLQQISGEDAEKTPAGSLLWRQQDVTHVLGLWCSAVPTGNVRVVTVPPPGGDPADLWRRFATVLGIDPDGYEIAEPGRNASLGLESAELMRRVNELVVERGLPRGTYNRVFKNQLAKSVLSVRRTQETPVVLPSALHDWAASWAGRQVQAIQSSGVEVVGDLRDLQPFVGGAQPGEEITRPASEKVLDAAVEALVALALDPPGRRGPRAGPGTGSARTVPARPPRAREIAGAARARVRRLVGRDRHVT